jgi:two-component system sensor histidine kinase LytS
VDAGTDGARVPPFSIQTLVENAIRHGIAPKEDGGTLRVRVGEEGTALVVVVEDDGRGLDPAAHDASTGTGLRNLRERLVGRFGTRASLDVAPRQPQGCVARLVLPLEATS